MAWGLVVDESDAAGGVGVQKVPNGPKGVGERGTVLADEPTVRGVGFDLNRLRGVWIEGHIEMNLSAADRDNGVVVEVFHAA